MASKRCVGWKNILLKFRFLLCSRINRGHGFYDDRWNAVSFKVWGGEKFSRRASDGDIVVNSDHWSKPTSRGFISVMLWEAYLGREEGKY